MARSSRSHILNLPEHLTTVRIFQSSLAFPIMGLLIYVCLKEAAMDQVPIKEYWGFLAIGIFTPLATSLIIAYMLIAERCVPVIYNYWAILGLEILAVLGWLVFSALTAIGAGVGMQDGLAQAIASPLGRVVIAIAVLSMLELILFIVTLRIFSYCIHQHRKAGRHCQPLLARSHMPEKTQIKFDMSTVPVLPPPRWHNGYDPLYIPDAEPVDGNFQSCSN